MAKVTVDIMIKFKWYTKPVAYVTYIYWRLFKSNKEYRLPSWAYEVKVS